ncbi:sialidase family protein [Massilia scottii]|uniref:sialidase family protein n=1 Tax=Massilia scottii TaxID=3057166 RepID=UPI0027968F82|nr:sialidase family protein [Massilia sp. CCM 9029]MDQ1830709.1 sialidase family protein [Massilia sp. CCM 9029]
MTSNTGQISGIDQITVQRLSEAQVNGEGGLKETFVLPLVATGFSSDTSFFSGALAPGEYRVYSFSDKKTKKILQIPQHSRLLGNFVVKGDKPVDLGRLIMTPMQFSVVYGRSMTTPSNLPLLERFAPEYAKLLAGAVDSGWKVAASSAPAPGAVEMYALGRPVGASCVTELADGRVVAASRLGAVLIRSTGGTWSAVRGPGIESLLCVTPTTEPGAELVAMGEFGTLLRKPEGVNQLLPVDTGNLPPGRILRLYGDARTGWVLALERSQEISLFHSATLQAGNWSLIRKEDISAAPWGYSTDFFMWRTANGFAYALTGGVIHFYDLASKAWTERPIPNKASRLKLAHGPSGALLALTIPGPEMGALFTSMFISKDQATSWQPMSSPFSVTHRLPAQTADGTLLIPGGLNGTELQGSKDDGRTWARVGGYDIDRTLFPLRSGTLIDYDNGKWGVFSIRRSTDGGKTWVAEHDNARRRADEKPQGM